MPNLENLSDRELILLTAQSLEQVAKVDIPEIKQQLKDGHHTLEDHGIRIVKLETTRKVERRFLDSGKAKIGVYATMIAGVITALVKAFGGSAPVD